LRAIVTKALAPEPDRRYRSAELLQSDLQAFLERRPTVAEMERRAAWGANATIEAAREYLHKATRTLVRVRRTLKVAGAAAWFLLGMMLWIGGTLAFQRWGAHPTHAARATPPAPKQAVQVRTPDSELPRLYQAEAEKILAAYRDSADNALEDFDWHKAEIYLERAGAGDGRAAGELALAKGYATMERLADEGYSPEAAAHLRSQGRAELREAAAQLRDDPGPHLALARLYVYVLPDVPRAMEEFAEAERLGATFGRREIEQQADAYRLRAQRQAAARPRQARSDAQKARDLYARIPGFDQADAHVREIQRIRYGAARRRGWR
jgi:hypothetical protein